MWQAEPTRGSERGVGLASAVWVVLLAGVLHASSLAWPWNLPPLLGAWSPVRGQAQAWLQMATLSALVVVLLRSASVWHAAILGWLFATVWLGSTFSWLYTSMHQFGDLSAPLAALAVAALAAALALYYALACAVFWLLVPTKSILCALYFAACWTLAELARGQWLSGFGWGSVGYAHVDGALSAWLPWLGVYGVCACAAWCAASVAVLVRTSSARNRWLAAGALALAVGAPQLVPVDTGAFAGQLRVTLLQGNIAQEEKFQPATGVVHALRWYGQRLLDADADLVVTPETAFPVLPAQLPDGYWDALQQRFASGEQAALLGLPLGDAELGYTNSVLGWRPGRTEPWRYDKHHLVPFGEFIPPMFRWFTELLHIPLGDFNRGALPQPTFDWKGQRIAATICYENLFSEELATQFADPGRAPTLLLNISNLGWFGEHLAMDQHLNIARTRALEFDRSFVLVTNTGHSAVVDHRGQVTQQIAPHSVAVMRATVQGRDGLTPYARWSSRWGQTPLWLWAVLTLGWAARRRHRARP